MIRYGFKVRRDGRVVECGGLENRCSPSGEPGVRIPLSPQILPWSAALSTHLLNEPSNILFFTQTSNFLIRQRENILFKIMKKAVGLKYISVGQRPTLDLELILSPVVGEIKTICFHLPG
jgi:hypothetical protein